MVKSFVISIPKSGTYLLREILTNAGTGTSHLHISESGTYDYSKVSYELGRSNPRLCKTRMPLKESIAQIPNGSFAVGHLAYSKETAKLLSEFNVLFIGRCPKEVYLSFMIYQLETGRANRYKEDQIWVKEKNPARQFCKFLNVRGDKLMTKYFTRILPWKHQPNVVSFDYNNLRTNPFNEVRRMVNTLGEYSDQEVQTIITNSFETPTQTLSTKKDRSKYWSDAAHATIDDLITKYRIEYD